MVQVREGKRLSCPIRFKCVRRKYTREDIIFYLDLSDKICYTHRMESVLQQSYFSELSRDIIETLLVDRTTKKHLLWATNIYGRRGYRANDNIPIDALIYGSGSIIKPRVEKSKTEIQKRTRDKGEVFTRQRDICPIICTAKRILRASLAVRDRKISGLLGKGRNVFIIY